MSKNSMVWRSIRYSEKPPTWIGTACVMEGSSNHNMYAIILVVSSTCYQNDTINVTIQFIIHKKDCAMDWLVSLTDSL